MPEAEPLTNDWTMWIQTLPSASVSRRPDGALVVRRTDARPATVMEAIGEDIFVVTEEDGSWPARFAGLALAGAVVRTRQTLLHFPRAGRRFRGEPCWYSPALRSSKPSKAKYGRMNVSLAVAEGLGRHVSTTRRGKGGVSMPTHRVSFFVFHGAAPQLGTVDHACETPACANPLHLDDMTEEDNAARRAEKLSRIRRT